MSFIRRFALAAVLSIILETAAFPQAQTLAWIIHEVSSQKRKDALKGR